MRLYSLEQEEKLYVRREARAWERSGLITKAQQARFDGETDTGLKRTNLFMRLLLFVFTAIGLSSVIGFTLWFFELQNKTAIACVLILFGLAAYFCAEYLVKRYSLYRYGVEEALAVNAVSFIVAGAVLLLKPLVPGSSLQIIAICLLVCAGALWLHFRFGFLYAMVIALAALAVIPFQLSLSASSERIVLFALLALCLALNSAAGKRAVTDFQKGKNGIIQALLLLGMYLAVNLRITSSGNVFAGGSGRTCAGFPQFFYWTTYVVILIMPAVVLLYGFMKRKRAWIDTGLVIAVITVAVNKSYLGLRQYAWDPAVLGSVLIGAALLALRFLKNTRRGFTSENILKPEQQGIDLAAVGTAFAAPAGGEVPSSTETFSGGQSGGAGASRNF